MEENGSAEWRLFPQDGYEVVTDDSVKGVSLCPYGNPEKRAVKFFKNGMRVTLVGVLMTHRWLTPHVLIFIKDNPDEKFPPDCGLFSVKCNAGENPKMRLQNRLNTHLRDSGFGVAECQVGEFLGSWWIVGPNDQNNPSPYIPTHVTRPRENIRVYQILLPPECTFALPSNYTLKSISLPDLAFHTPPLANCIQQLSFLLCRFVFNYYEQGEDDDTAARLFHHAAAAVPPRSRHTQISATTDAPQKNQIKILADNLDD